MNKYIDAHLHVFKFKEHWSESAAKKWIESYPGKYWLTGKDFKPSDYDGPYDFAIEWMNKNGIEKAFLFGNWQTPNNIKVPLNYLVEAYEKYPNRFFPFCTPNPLDKEKSLKELEWAIRKKNFVGLKVLPTYNYIHPLDKNLFPLYKKTADLGGCIVVHTGYGPVTKNRLKWQHPYELEDLLIELPNTPISFGHCGFHYYKDAMLMMTRSKNLFGDFAWWHVLPIEFIVRALVFAKSLGVINRVMWGTDFPHVNPKDTIILYKKIPEFTEKNNIEPKITEEDMSLFFYKNAERFINSREKI